MSGYSTGLVLTLLANHGALEGPEGRLPRKSWALATRSGRRQHGGADFEVPSCYRVDLETGWARLDEEDRKLLHLRFLSGLPRYKVAQRVGCGTTLRLEPLVDGAIERLTRAMNGGETAMASNGNGHTNGKTAEEVRGLEMERLYDVLDHRLKDLPPGWRQLQVKREPGTKMFAVAVTY